MFLHFSDCAGAIVKVSQNNSALYERQIAFPQTQNPNIVGIL